MLSACCLFYPWPLSITVCAACNTCITLPGGLIITRWRHSCDRGHRRQVALWFTASEDQVRFCAGLVGLRKEVHSKERFFCHNYHQFKMKKMRCLCLVVIERLVVHFVSRRVYVTCFYSMCLYLVLLLLLKVNSCR